MIASVSGRVRLALLVAASVSVVVLSVPDRARAASDEAPCIAPDPVVHFSAPTPALTQAFRDGKAIRIVAFGSSSTEGTGASAQERTYPSRLSAALRRIFPGRQFTVVNRGKGGELARHMLARLERDVIAEAPTLVIWQTGVNDAIRGVAMDAFEATVAAGLAKLKALGIDVILLDQQYYPRAAKVKNYADYLKLLRRIGAEHNVPVFRRYQLMTHLIESRQYKVDELLAPDRFHQNDLSYNCLGTVIAEALKTRFDHAAGNLPAEAERASLLVRPKGL